MIMSCENTLIPTTPGASYLPPTPGLYWVPSHPRLARTGFHPTHVWLIPGSIPPTSGSYEVPSHPRLAHTGFHPTHVWLVRGTISPTSEENWHIAPNERRKDNFLPLRLCQGVSVAGIIYRWCLLSPPSPPSPSHTHTHTHTNHRKMIQWKLTPQSTPAPFDLDQNAPIQGSWLRRTPPSPQTHPTTQQNISSPKFLKLPSL